VAFCSTGRAMPANKAAMFSKSPVPNGVASLTATSVGMQPRTKLHTHTRFVDIDLGRESAPDETTVFRFRTHRSRSSWERVSSSGCRNAYKSGECASVRQLPVATASLVSL